MMEQMFQYKCSTTDENSTEKKTYTKLKMLLSLYHCFVL